MSNYYDDHISDPPSRPHGYARSYDRQADPVDVTRGLRGLSLHSPSTAFGNEDYDDEDEHYKEYSTGPAPFGYGSPCDHQDVPKSPSGLTRSGSSRSYTSPAALSYRDRCVARIEREIAKAPPEMDRVKPDKDGAWIKVDGMGWHLLKWEYLYVWLMDRECTASLPEDDIVRQTGEYLRARATPERWRNFEYHKHRQQVLAAAYRRERERDLALNSQQQFMPGSGSYPHQLQDSGYGTSSLHTNSSYGSPLPTNKYFMTRGNSHGTG